MRTIYGVNCQVDIDLDELNDELSAQDIVELVEHNVFDGEETCDLLEKLDEDYVRDWAMEHTTCAELAANVGLRIQHGDKEEMLAALGDVIPKDNEPLDDDHALDYIKSRLLDGSDFVKEELVTMLGDDAPKPEPVKVQPTFEEAVEVVRQVFDRKLLNSYFRRHELAQLFALLVSATEPEHIHNILRQIND